MPCPYTSGFEGRDVVAEACGLIAEGQNVAIIAALFDLLMMAVSEPIQLIPRTWAAIWVSLIDLSVASKETGACEARCNTTYRHHHQLLKLATCRQGAHRYPLVEGAWQGSRCAFPW